MKQLLLLLLIPILIHGAPTPTEDEKSTIFIDVDNKITYTGVSDKRMRCPNLLPDYAARIQHLDYISGVTTCSVYGKNPLTDEIDYTKVIGMVYEQNPYVRVYMNKLANEDSLRDSIAEKFGVTPDDTLNIKTEADKWYKEYTNTTKEFVPTSKMLISALTLDGSIIDLEKTLLLNELTLTNSYTNYPNMTEGDPTQKIFNTFKKYADDDGDTDELFAEKELSKSFDSTDAKRLMGNYIVLIVEFFAGFDELYRKIIFWVFLIALMVSALFFFQNKFTRKASGLHPQEDPWERVLIGILLIFFFFIPLTKYDVGGGEQIRQSGFHALTRYGLYKGVEWADEGTRILTKTYLNYAYKNAGMISSGHLFELSKEKKLTEQLILEQTSFLTACDTFYDKEKMKLLEGYTKDNIYPIGRTDDWNLLKDEYANNKAIMNTIPTVSACGNVLRDNLVKKEYLATVEFNIAKFNKYSNKTILQDRLKIVSEGMLKQTASNGFVSAPLIGAADAFFSATELLTTAEMREDMKNRNKESSAEKEKDELGLVEKTIKTVANRAPYMMLPGFDSMRRTIVSNLTISNESSFVLKIVKKFSFFKSVYEAAVIYVGTMLPIYIIKSILDYLPLLGIIVGSFLTIVFYFISVLYFYVIVPFMVAYAFTAQQPQVLVSFMIRFSMAIMRPMILIISIVMALVAVSLFNGIYQYVIEPFFTLFHTILSEVSIMDAILSFGDIADSFKSLGSGFIMGSIEALIRIFTSIAVFYAAFYITFYGADIVFNLFGVKERGTDSQETIGGNMDSSTSRGKNVL